MYIEVEDVNDMAPWPERAAYAAAVPEHCAAGTRVAVVRATDADAAPSNITYSIVAGNPDGLFSIDEHTGTPPTTTDVACRHVIKSNQAKQVLKIYFLYR